jgi:hypothetical protein
MKGHSLFSLPHFLICDSILSMFRNDNAPQPHKKGLVDTPNEILAILIAPSIYE